MNRQRIIPVIVALLFLISACQELFESEHYSQIENIKHNTPDSISYDLCSTTLINETGFIEVLPDNESIHPFYVISRTDKMVSFQCSNCHSKPLDELNRAKEAGAKNAHWDINMNHAKEDLMKCSTCHGDSKNNSLISLAGDSISFNNSARLCNQCHSTQYKDWEGGAHGKRIGGWVPPRVVNTCVNCHNPHKPGFEKRWPARLNTATLIESDGGH